MRFNIRSFLLIVFVSLLLFTRFIKLDWGDGYYFHPDENNMATAVSRLSSSNLDPNFYAYGQFPLYLTYFTNQFFHLPNTFSQSIFTLRFYSAIFSCFTVLFLYLISKKLFNQKVAIIFSLLLIFYPGLIQLSHFGTTESLLILTFVINLYLGLKIYETKRSPQTYYLLLASLNNGIALASKISSLFFIIPILIALIISRHFIKIIPFLIFTLTFFIVFSPYNFIKFSEFLSTSRYETEVAIGIQKVFYTSQFLHTTPYLFQLTKIFPYVSGLPVYLFSIIGLVFLVLNKKKIDISKILIIFVPCLLYFLYFGQLYTKWTRFMSPVFFIFPLFAAYLISKISNKLLFLSIFLLSIFPGIIFLSIYFQPDIRLKFSQWVTINVSPNSNVLSEAGNVINLPLGPFSSSVTNFDFYNLDQDPRLQQQLPSLVQNADYILVPSRRIFKNQFNSDFLISQNYYQNLFSGSSGFKLIKTFSYNSDFLLNSENAEETWSVFDRPTIRLFQKI